MAVMLVVFKHGFHKLKDTVDLCNPNLTPNLWWIV